MIRLTSGITVIAAAAWLAGCAPATTVPAGQSPATTPTSSSRGVDISVTGAITDHFVSASPVPCSASVGNSGQPMLALDLSHVTRSAGAQTQLDLTVVDFTSMGSYAADTVWAADGATSVALDSNNSEPIASERFLATSGEVHVTSAGASAVAGSVDAQPGPESPTTPSSQVAVSGSWSCTLS